MGGGGIDRWMDRNGGEKRRKRRIGEGWNQTMRILTHSELVNFSEFYYNQMDKYGKQTVAEGIQKREDIIVTRDSEIFKQLNQHYNRNNHIEVSILHSFISDHPN